MVLKSWKLLAAVGGIAVFGAALGAGMLVGSGGSTNSPVAAKNAGSQSILSMLENSSGQDAATPSTTPGAGNKGLNPTVEDFLQKLATRLGISEDTLKADLQQTSLDELQQLVTDGKLTQAQADKIKSAITSGSDLFPPLFGGFGNRGGNEPGMGGHGPGGMFGILGKNEAALAQWLGISTDTLRSDLAGGQSLAEIATAQKKTAADLKTFLTGELDTSLKAEVTAGKLTQAQSDKISAAFAANLDTLINGKLPAFGGPHMRRNGPSQGATPAPGTSNTGGGGASTTS